MPMRDHPFLKSHLKLSHGQIQLSPLGLNRPAPAKAWEQIANREQDRNASQLSNPRSPLPKRYRRLA